MEQLQQMVKKTNLSGVQFHDLVLPHFWINRDNIIQMERTISGFATQLVSVVQALRLLPRNVVGSAIRGRRALPAARGEGDDLWQGSRPQKPRRAPDLRRGRRSLFTARGDSRLRARGGGWPAAGAPGGRWYSSRGKACVRARVYATLDLGFAR